MHKKSKFIFVVGGVMSGIGKGITAAAIGRILKDKNFSVTAIKIDPYINIDAGTMNPVEHGEVFVTFNGHETDQDIGNYERFLDENISGDNYMTTGRIYESVIRRERNLEYKGRCVEVIPDIPEEVIGRIDKISHSTKADFIIIEIGGTVGEYQNMVFLEALRMMGLRYKNKVLTVLVSYLPVPKIIGEMKTKPTQWAARSLNSAGIQPNIIVARSSMALDEPRKRKLSIFCNIEKENVISAPDIKSIYDVPINFEKDCLSARILKHFNMRDREKNDKSWEKMVKNIKNSKKIIRIGIVGKYFDTGNFILSDSYISVIEAIKHAAHSCRLKPKISWLNAERYFQNQENLKELKSFNSIIVPGGFGERGVEGKIKAIQFCRENKIPFLGLCYGMQLAVIEFARNVCGLKNANTTEIDNNTPYPVINTMIEQKVLIKQKKMGGTMRLGEYACKLMPKTKTRKLYKAALIKERHRHRYEINNQFLSVLEKRGLVIAGLNPERGLVEIIELKNHPFFIGTQFHPEFISRPLKPHPLFLGLIRIGKSNYS